MSAPCGCGRGEPESPPEKKLKLESEGEDETECDLKVEDGDQNGNEEPLEYDSDDWDTWPDRDVFIKYFQQLNESDVCSFLFLIPFFSLPTYRNCHQNNIPSVLGGR